MGCSIIVLHTCSVVEPITRVRARQGFRIFLISLWSEARPDDRWELYHAAGKGATRIDSRRGMSQFLHRFERCGHGAAILPY